MESDDPHDGRKAAPVSETETETEKALGAIWCEVLAVPTAGPEDNFFGLGGNSLHAMQAVARARRALGCPQLKLADVFRAATLRELAQRVDALSAAGRT